MDPSKVENLLGTASDNDLPRFCYQKMDWGLW